MKKLIVVLIFACLVSLASLPVVSTYANSKKIRVTKTLWNISIGGTAVISQTIPDVDDDGHEDILIASYNDTTAVGYLTLIDGRNGTTIREISLDYEPTEVLYVQESDRIAVARRNGTDVYDTQLDHKFTIPLYQSWAYMYHSLLYWTGATSIDSLYDPVANETYRLPQADYVATPSDRYFKHKISTPYGEWTLGPYQYGWVGEVPWWWMEIAANRTAELPHQKWDPYSARLNASLNENYGWSLPTSWAYTPKHLVTFDGTDLLLCGGNYGTTDNHTDVLSYSIIDGSLIWRSAALNVPLTDIQPVPGLLDIPHGRRVNETYVVPFTQIFGSSIFGLHDLKVLSPTRGVGLMNTIGFAGMNFTNPSPIGEWPLILLDNNGSHVEMAARATRNQFPFFYATTVENATYEQHTVSPIMPYDENRFLVTVTGVEASVLVCYTIEYDNFTIVWKRPLDRGDLNQGFLIDDQNNDGEKEIIAVLDGNITVFDGADGSKLYGTDISTFLAVDVAKLSMGDVILTNEGGGYLVSFEGSNITTLWKPYLGPAWETFINPMQDVDGDNLKDLVVATGNNVTCLWGYFEIYTPPPLPIQEELWFWIAIMVVLDAVVIGVVGYMRRRALARETAATA